MRYGLSMLYSNTGSERKCLDEALLSASLYRALDDPRGLARALSQVASRYAPQSRYGEAKTAAEEALRLARATGDRRLLADVLRRCAESFGDEGHDPVRARYEESVAVFRSLGRDDDTSRALQWWGQWENNVGDHLNAAQRLLEAAQLTDRDAALVFLTTDIASAFLAAGDRTRAEPFARRALTLATKAGHDVPAALAISYLAVIASEKKPPTGARLIGYAEERFRILGWELLAPDSATIADLHDFLRKELPEAELAVLYAEGAAWNEERGFSEALSS